jgi:hypothetical protein
MPYIVQARMSQFGYHTNYDPQTFATFPEALLYIKEQMLNIRGRMWEHILPKYQTFMCLPKAGDMHLAGGVGGNHPIEAVTTIPESDDLLLFFGSSHSNCECWSFEVTKSD